jgi:hypothetical protein
MTLVDGIHLAESKHIPGLVKLAVNALTADPIPNQRISVNRLQGLAETCVLIDYNYSIVSVKNGEVVAALSALVHDQLVYERKMATVVQFYTLTPGEGVKLIREFLRWARSLRKIKAIAFTLERGADPRIGSLLSKLGLNSEMPVYVEWR